MGCGASLPVAETFLSTPQPSPAEGYLASDWPSRLKMTGWSYCSGYHHPSEAGSLAMVAHVFEENGELDETANWSSSGCGKGGCGKPEQLQIHDEQERLLATLCMPRHLSFGIGAKLLDAEGNTIALMVSAESKRPHGMFSSSYQVLAPRPYYEGQPSVSGSWYLWASVKRAPFTFSVKIFDPQGVQISKGYTYMGYAGNGFASQKWKCETMTKHGLMLCLPTNEQPKRHDIQCAEGVDAALQVCLMYAAKLANDELFQPEHRNGSQM